MDCQEMKGYDDCTSEHYRARVLKECKCLPFSMATNEVFFLHINFLRLKKFSGAALHCRDVEMCRKYG